MRRSSSKKARKNSSAFTMNITKKQRRQRRAVKTRAQIRELKLARLTVHRTPRHIYAQLFDGKGEKVLAAASTVQKDVAQGLKGTGNIEAARVVGRTIAERAKAAGVTRVAFDRAGFQYHGRVKALADAAREAGLEF
jgi:large subunit ribosomal protein L18